jgi:hypothetical protein
MINSTTTYADGNTAATSGISMFATVLGQVKTKMVLINGLNIIAGGTSKGVTLDTNALRTAMESLAAKCAAGTYGFGSSTSNNTLKALVNYKEYQLQGIKKEDVDDVCEKIQQATDTNIAGAMTFGVAATDPADLLIAINLYRTATQNPRNAIIAKSQANDNAVQMVGEIIKDLFEDQLDRMVETLKVSDNAYWKAWKQAREIIDLGSTTGKARGSVKTELDVPLSNVKFSIFNAGTTDLVKFVITDAKGRFNAPGLLPGNYDFKWELAGYITVTESNFKLSAGKEVQRKIVMKAV